MLGVGQKSSREGVELDSMGRQGELVLHVVRQDGARVKDEYSRSERIRLDDHRPIRRWITDYHADHKTD